MLMFQKSLHLKRKHPLLPGKKQNDVCQVNKRGSGGGSDGVWHKQNSSEKKYKLLSFL